MSWTARLRSFFRGNRLNQDLDDEFQFHLEMRARERASVEEARRRFGNVALLKEKCREIDTIGWLETTWQDLRYAFRTLCRSPGFAVVAVLSLALGIGANTAIFSMMDSILWKALPVKDPAHLVWVVTVTAGSSRQGGIPYALFHEARNGNEVFSGMLTSGADGVSLVVDGAAERIMPEVVSSNYFSVLGVHAVAGRNFSDAGDKESWQPEAVLSYDFWKRRFSGEPSVIGKTIQLNGYPFTIAGVSPPGFFGIQVGIAPELRIPKLPQALSRSLPAMDLLDPSAFPGVMARLKPGVSIQEAQAETDVTYQRFLQDHPRINANPRYHGSHIRLHSASRGASFFQRQFEQPLLVLMALVGLVLLIACSNVANLLLGRAAARRKEIAVRLAIGASRGRLVRQLLTESLLLSTLGGAVGLLFAFWGAAFLFGFVPQSHMPIALHFTPDFRALSFTLGLAFLTGILFGLAPALQATSPRLRVSPSTRRRVSASGFLVVSEVALSLVLLLAAGLFIRTLRNVQSVHAGFQPENVLLFTMKHVHERYTPDQIRNFCRQLIERVELLPGVRVAALAEMGPFSGREGRVPVSVPGYQPQSGDAMQAEFDRVSPGFFGSLGIPLLLGRDFAFADREGARKVAIINEVAARDFFGSENPIGRRIEFGRPPDVQQFEIIGVVKASKYRNLKEPDRRALYLSILQGDKPWMPTLFVRATSQPSQLIPLVHHEFQSLDPNLPVFNVKTFVREIDESMAQERLVATLSGFFGALAALLAAIGLYGVMAYGVAGRTREIGIRMALGARRGVVLRLVLRETLLLVAAGVAIGVHAALAAARLISSLLFGLSATDPITLAAAIFLLVLVAAVSGYVPARRASRVDPMVALRYE